MLNVIIASKNPVKINSVKIAFEKMFSGVNFEFEGISVPSDVPDQPMSNKETFTGAQNRAKNAKSHSPKADYWIGIEGGLEKVEEGMEAFAWIYILSNENSGKSRTSTFFLPKKIIALINQGMELGEADDIVFRNSNSKQKNGAVGILTGDVMNRTDYYSEAVNLALIPFKNPNLYL